MIRRCPLAVALSLALAACGENATPTQPETGGDPASAAPSFAVASNTWTVKAPMPGQPYLYGISAGVVANAAGQSILYAFGGTTSSDGGSGFPTQAYNVATNTWTTKASSVPVFQSNGVGKIGSKLYFSGGYDYAGGTREIVWTTWAYDPATDGLIRKADMPKATADGVTGVIDGKLYVLPGTCSGEGWPSPGYCDHEPIRQLFRYDPVANHWGARRASPHYLRNCAGGVINGKFYVAGGLGNTRLPTAALDAYDPATDTWKTLAPVPTAGPAVGAVLQGKLFVITQGSGGVLHAYAYNPSTNGWTTKAAPASAADAVAWVNLDGHAHLLAVSINATELYTP